MLDPNMREFPYLRHITNLASLVLKKYSDGNNSDMNSKSIPYTLSEQYIVDGLLTLGEIETTLEQLNQSPFFLSNFRQNPNLKKQGIDRFQHIIYHIESHLFRTTGLLDRLLIHINTVFQFGLEPKDCKPYLMLENQNGKPGKYFNLIKDHSSELGTELLEIFHLINEVREPRNTISHQERYRSEHLKYVEMYSILSNDTMPNEWNQGMYYHHFKLRTDEAVRKSKHEMIQFNEQIAEHLDCVYRLLYPIWKEQYKEIQTHNKCYE